MELVIKRYHELTVDELYEIMQIRVAVFVVEQNCPYQELDGRDREAIHLWLRDETGIKAYLRVLDRGASYEDVSLGRVLVTDRRRGLGSQILKAGIQVAKEQFEADFITIEAQTYAMGLYEKVGFRQISEEFLEDGIPHILMRLDVKECS